MPIARWKVLGSEYIHRSPWATLRRDKCLMPDGRIMPDYYVLEYPNWVNVVAITEDNMVVMVKQYRHAGGIVSLEVPGGVIDGNEAPEDAARRELLEETGYEFRELELLATVYPNPATANNITHLYLARGGRLVAPQCLDEYEEIIIELLTLQKVRELLFNNQISQALHCTALFYALQKLELHADSDC